MAESRRGRVGTGSGVGPGIDGNNRGTGSGVPVQRGLRAFGANLAAKNYTPEGNIGVWTSARGAPLGYSATEDQPVIPWKHSIGQVGTAISAFVKQRKAAGTKGY